MDEARRIYGNKPELLLCDDRDEALDGADALMVVTEWNEFRSPDFSVVKKRLKHPVVFDGRNLFDPAMMKDRGFSHFSIGRPSDS